MFVYSERDAWIFGWWIINHLWVFWNVLYRYFPFISIFHAALEFGKLACNTKKNNCLDKHIIKMYYVWKWTNSNAYSTKILLRLLQIATQVQQTLQRRRLSDASRSDITPNRQKCFPVTLRAEVEAKTPSTNVWLVDARLEINAVISSAIASAYTS